MAYCSQGRLNMPKLLRNVPSLFLCLLGALFFIWFDGQVLNGMFLHGALSFSPPERHSLRRRLPMDIPYHMDQIEEHVQSNAAIGEAHAVKEDSEIAPAPGKLPYLFVDVYSEQIGRSVNNFARLLTYSGKLKRRLVQPFVHGSRLSGMHRTDLSTPQDFSYYFNLENFRSLLQRRNFPPLVSVDDLQKDCPYGWDVVLLLQYEQHALSRPVVGTAKNMKSAVDECRKAAEESKTGHADCNILPKVARLLPTQRRNRKANPAQYRKQIKSARGLVISTSHFHDIVKLGQMLGEARCVQLMEWAGEGDKRANFQGLTSEEERNQLRPYEIQHSSKLIAEAKKFAKNNLGSNYYAVHLRAEKLLKFGSTVEEIKKCLDSVSKVVAELRSKKPGKLFLMTDMGEHGSDTLGKHISDTNRIHLKKYTEDLFADAVLPAAFGVVDHGARALIEMEIAAAASDLIAIGGGNFQEWMAVLFLKASGRQARRQCTQTKVPTGWETTGANVLQ